MMPPLVSEWPTTQPLPSFSNLMYRSNFKLKLQHPPPPRANPRHLTVHCALGGGNLNVAVEGWGIWTRFTSCSSKICTWVFSVFAFFSDFQDRISPYALKTVFKRSLKLSSWHISLWKAWTVFDWRRNFSLKRGISVLMGGAFERLFCHEGREFGQTNLQKFKCPGGGDVESSICLVHNPLWISFQGSKFTVTNVQFVTGSGTFAPKKNNLGTKLLLQLLAHFHNKYIFCSLLNQIYS